MTSLRDYAFRKFQEAKQKSVSLASLSYEAANSSLSTSGSYIIDKTDKKDTFTLDKRLEEQRTINEKLGAVVSGQTSDVLEKSVNKLELIGESLAFTIENIQESGHMTKLSQKQLREAGTSVDSFAFYK